MTNFIPSWLPVLPIRNTVIFPGQALPIRAGRPASIAAIRRAQEPANSGWVLAVAETPDQKGIYSFGTLCKVERARSDDNDGFQVLLRGVSRYRVQNQRTEGDLRLADATEIADQIDLDEKTNDVLLHSVKTLSLQLLELIPADTSHLQEIVEGMDNLSLLSYLCSANLELPVDKKQDLLETIPLRDRVLKLLELMNTQKDSLQVRSEIRDKLSHKLGKGQRELILREQLKAIHEELGDNEGSEKTPDDFRKKIEEAGMPDDVRKTALDELRRLETIGNASPESHVIRSYIELLCAMPWKNPELSGIDLEHARSVLDAEHFGLEKVKKRILQNLAVMKLKKSPRGSILLLVGPPGVGKTSLGQSVARALGRKFARASLGGVRDDAEIRGHRRTYIGAMPGRIIQAMKRAGTKNPVFMLDEIDKLGRGYSGDPSAALLEVLDPEQNATFHDHYLDVPYDLSQVFFIATANSLDSIPGPLLDRMEIIELSGYTPAEKLHIAKNHLVGKQLLEVGLSTDQCKIPDEILRTLIAHHTREAGVRDLQRKIAALARVAAIQFVALPEGSVYEVNAADVDEALGPERFTHEQVERKAEPGFVTGLAWTPMGGEILFIEATQMPGSGRLTLTGQLGDVMKESAQIAMSLVRTHLPRVAPEFSHEKSDLHIHVPAGAIPKDGPSAGIALMTTIASLVSGKAVSPKLAMTGEITLRGAVLPVGGIKEKVIAAHRAGIEHILMSKRNERDLRDVPEEVRSQIRFEFVETASDVLRIALGLSLREIVAA